MVDRVVYEMHAHTPLCRHAEGEPEAYAEAAQRRGLAGIVFTCHNPMPVDYGHSGRMAADEVDLYAAMVERARRTFAGTIDVRLGMECDFFPGYERYVEQTTQRLPLHHVLGSVHCHLPIWRRRYATSDDAVRIQQRYFEHLAASAETGLFDTIAHPDLIKNMTAEAWQFDRLRDHVAACLDRIAAVGTAMELNTSGLLKHIPEMNPTPAMLQLMRQRDIPVVVGADAHVPQRVGAEFERAYDLLEQAGYERVSYFLDRRRHELPLSVARQSLRSAGDAPSSWKCA